MIKRYFWVAHVVLVTLAAWLGADMVTAYLGAKLATPFAVRPPQASNAPDRQSQVAQADYAVISERNIFNATPPKDAPVTDKPSAPPPPPQDAPPTQLQLKLVGTVAGAQNQRFAIIEDLVKRGIQAMYQVGDTVQSASITAIDRKCVTFNNAGQPEKLCFPEDSSDDPSTRRQPQAPGGPPSARAGDDSGITRVDNATWSVSRDLLLTQFGNFSSLAAQARMIPHMVQGQSQGFRLVQLAPDSMLQKIGLQNNDVLQKVNGLNINSPAEALQAFQQLHNESKVRLEILRQNRPTILTYDIR